jgi:hypothetical protein
VRKWICIIAGGPDHRAEIPQWCEPQEASPPPFESSDGQIVRPITCTVLNGVSRCVMMHPTATPAEVGEAVDAMTGYGRPIDGPSTH